MGKAEKFPDVKHHPLTAWRFRKGLTLAQIAKMMDPPASTGNLSKIEAGAEPTLGLAQRLCALTGLHIEDFSNQRGTK